MTTNTKLLRLAAAWSILAAILACGGNDGASSAASEEQQARSEALRALETHLGESTTYGEGPDAEALAQAVREALAPEDGVAVRVTSGNPRNVTVLVRYRSGGGYEDLREVPVAERNEEIDRIVAAIDESYGARADNLAVAIRGAVFYGAVGVRMANAAIQYHTGSVVSLSVIDPVLTAAAGEDAPVPALTLGAQVQGTVVAPPANPPSYRLELAEDSILVTQLVTPASDESAFVALCPGAQRPFLCGEDETLTPIEDFQNDGLDASAERLEEAGRTLDYQAYRLAAGTYTAVVLSNCDFEGPCPTAGTAYTLLVAAPSARE